MSRQLLKKIRALRRRLVWLGFCHKFLRVLKWGGLLVLIFLVVSRLVPLPVGLTLAARCTAAAGLLVLIAWIAARPIRLLDAAVSADEALGLKERLSSALVLKTPQTDAERAVIRDAWDHASGIRPGRVFRGNLYAQTGRGLAPLLLLALVWWLMPQFNLLARKQEEQKKLAQAVAVKTQKEAARKLEILAKSIAESDQMRKSEMAGQLAKELDALARKLNEQKIAPERALAEVTRMQDRMEARRAEIEKQLAMPPDLTSKGAGRNTQAMQEALQKGNFKEAAKQLEDLKKKLQQEDLSDQQKQEVQKELQNLAKQLGQNSPLAKALSDATAKMDAGQFNEALANLEDAAGAALDMEALLKELKNLDSLKDDVDARKLALAAKELCEGCKSGGT